MPKGAAQWFPERSYHIERWSDDGNNLELTVATIGDGDLARAAFLHHARTEPARCWTLRIRGWVILKHAPGGAVQAPPITFDDGNDSPTMMAREVERMAVEMAKACRRRGLDGVAAALDHAQHKAAHYVDDRLAELAAAAAAPPGGAGSPDR